MGIVIIVIEPSLTHRSYQIPFHRLQFCNCAKWKWALGATHLSQGLVLGSLPENQGLAPLSQCHYDLWIQCANRDFSLYAQAIQKSRHKSMHSLGIVRMAALGR